MIAHDCALASLGWNDHWAEAAAQFAGPGQPGRVVVAGRLLSVQLDRQCVLAEVRAVPPGRNSSDRPVCGDWVIAEVMPGASTHPARALIRALLPRRNALVRRAGERLQAQSIAANVDCVWLVCGLDRDQGVRSLPRYLAMTLARGIDVTIVLNKRDQARQLEAQLDQARIAAPTLERLMVSCLTGQGLEVLRERLAPGRTIALLGPSGVGKSTLVNTLVDRQAHRTQDVRERDQRGRHTTSSAQLEQTESGALIIDTPGLRELGLWQASQGLAECYSDITDLAQGCRFRDCQHATEPGCQVRAAIECGQLSNERFLAYLELIAPSRKHYR